MIRDADFDRLLTGWLSEGPGARARGRHRGGAGHRRDDAAASTPGRVGSGGSDGRGRPPRRPPGLILAALLLVLAAVAIGVGAGLIRLPSPVQETTPPVPECPSLRPVQIEDWPVKLSIPSTWTEIEGPCCDYRQFAGTITRGPPVGRRMSRRSGPPCAAPIAETIELPMTIPYSAERPARRAEGSRWPPSPAARLGHRWPRTSCADRGRRPPRHDRPWRPTVAPWRRVHIVGLRERNVVAIAWSQPADEFDEALLDSVLASIELKPAPVYSDGDLIDPSPGEGARFHDADPRIVDHVGPAEPRRDAHERRAPASPRGAWW